MPRSTEKMVPLSAIARKAGCHHMTVWRAVQAGEMVAYRNLGTGWWRVPEKEAVAWVKRYRAKYPHRAGKAT